LRALEEQFNPHFLFNSLNSIRPLVVENPPLAQDMLTRLANILRYSLRRDLLHTIPLADELAAVRDYLALEGHTRRVGRQLPLPYSQRGSRNVTCWSIGRLGARL